MKKLLVFLIVSAPLFFITSGFAASNAPLYNPALRADTMSLYGVNTAFKAGKTYAYWHRGHWHNRYYHRPYYKPWRHGYGHRYHRPYYRHWNHRYHR